MMTELVANHKLSVDAVRPRHAMADRPADRVEKSSSNKIIVKFMVNQDK